MRLCLILFAILAVSVNAKGRGLTQVWIGWDANVSPEVLSQSEILFGFISFVSVGTFNATDGVEVANALSNAEVVFLCPSYSPMALSPTSSSLLREFVSGGGVLIYPAGFNDTRSKDVAEWLQNPVLQVNYG